MFANYNPLTVVSEGIIGVAEFWITMPNLELSDGFSPIVIRHCDAGRREPGYIVVSLEKSIRAISRSSEFEALIALDRNEDVAWY